MNVRAAHDNPGDLARTADLADAQLREHGIPVERSALEGILKEILSDSDGGFILLAEAGERVMGMAYVAFIRSLEHAGRCGWLEELYVDPAARGLGVGTRLLDAALERAAHVGCRAVDLEIDAGHARAAELYRRKGFRLLDRTRWVRPVGPTTEGC